ncbi:MAG TPA: hypothetical protein VI893_09680 [Thermoplasmata archaeon]|nr:hypothetical protein [Thermoplasmata archaeon]
MAATRELPQWAKNLLASTDMKSVVEAMNATEPDFKWFHSNLEDLRRTHSEMFVAIKDRAVVSSKADFKELLADLSERSIDTKSCVIEFVTPKDWQWVL